MKIQYWDENNIISFNSLPLYLNRQWSPYCMLPPWVQNRAHQMQEVNHHSSILLWQLCIYCWRSHRKHNCHYKIHHHCLKKTRRLTLYLCDPASWKDLTNEWEDNWSERCLLYRRECFTRKYTTCEILMNLHRGPAWYIFHILTSEGIFPLFHGWLCICIQYICMANDRFMSII